MATKFGDDGPDRVDHIVGGYQAMQRLGQSRDGVFTASLGHDEHGDEQLLVLSGQTLVRMSTKDGGASEEIHRSEIRSVELAPQGGLLFRSARKRWLHVLSDLDANNFREAFIELPLVPPTSAGGLAIPDTNWRDDQLAHMVGLVVMRAAEAEHNLGLVAALGGTGAFDRTIFGRTGKPLAERLAALGEASPAIADMAERYNAWSPLRNQLVHSVRPMTEGGYAGPMTQKPVMGLRGNVPYTVEKQDLPELVDLWYAFNWLYFDAMHAFLKLTTGTAATDLPLPDSVWGAERLPTRRAAPAE